METKTIKQKAKEEVLNFINSNEKYIRLLDLFEYNYGNRFPSYYNKCVKDELINYDVIYPVSKTEMENDYGISFSEKINGNVKFILKKDSI